MFFRRILMTALITAAQNPEVQKKAGKVAGKALKVAKPSLVKMSRKVGNLTRKVASNLTKQ